jgi:hypothetical protein
MIASRKLQGDDVSVLLVFWQNWLKMGLLDESNGIVGSAVVLTKKVPVPEVFVAVGAAMAKFTPLLCVPPTATMTFPDVVHGTGATILLLVELDGVDVTPLNVTVLPCAKLAPVIVTDVPWSPDAGDKLLMTGATVKVTPLLATPLTLTTTGPLVALVGTTTTMAVSLQLVGATPFPATAIPFSVAVLKPRVAPNPDP